MRQSLFLAVALHALVVTAIPVAADAYAEEVLRARANRRELRLVNAHARAAIVRVWVTSASRIDWGSPVLDEPLRHGESARVFVTTPSADCVYHVRAQFEGGRIVQRMRVHLCSGRAVAFR